MSAEKVSIEAAKADKLFYVVANSVVYREENGRCLILKRHEREKVHPGKWATIGGKLEHGNLDINNPSRTDGEVIEFDDSIPQLIAREALEESGVTVELPAHFIGTKVIVRGDGIPVAILKFAAKYKSGEVKPEEGAFTDFAWVNGDEIAQYDCIEGVAEEVKATIDIFKGKSS